MAYMVYLIIVTARTIPKIWDPYDVLGVARVRTSEQHVEDDILTPLSSLPARSRSSHTTEDFH